MKKVSLLIACLLVFLLWSCGKDERQEPAFEGFVQPAGFPAPAYNIAGNPVTKAGFELGRKLFYEPRLSRNNTISCGSCHLQTSAFTHHGHDISHGIDDRLGSRNAPPIMNLAWSPTLMWDGGIFDLDLQPVAPITNFVEMDEKMSNVLEKLKNTAPYPELFRKAFGNEGITTATMMKAMSQFMIMVVSNESKYDSVMRGQASFLADEKKGYELFLQHCNACHTAPLFTDHSFRNNGIGIGPNNDQGRYAITLNPDDMYRFKVPSLRNLAYTAPYMHDGRFYTLNGVLTHYTSEVQDMPTLDPLLKSNGKRGIALTVSEQQELLAFLNTLNDKKFITEKKFSQEAQ
ncbi:cytochrome c peroxidase [Chitinophaga terrae (ex Kim and Jung 2007)]|uniref:Cytochrome c peroxidase n=1 Tax=Chitinophaga terrae (ex Kim and Jung 2007) TaxID=408074 RepID=A0A1H4BKC0_9BACT|nr:cytochrome c peroxidase [Chitinophaga terrae (ex Kim and Jung 2007)]GEP89614.1 cytochrome-c peroxidase [Chitinophaga terrae (ex Kim and Jung 2007)]SEA48546.1 cytochrome c peroxidase [Chitinophaga terrae (ex Kim and Jung 2007)]